MASNFDADADSDRFPIERGTDAKQYVATFRLTENILSLLEQKKWGPDDITITFSKQGSKLSIGDQTFPFTQQALTAERYCLVQDRNGMEELGPVTKKLVVAQELGQKEKAEMRKRTLESEKLRKAKKSQLLDAPTVESHPKPNSTTKFPIAKRKALTAPRTTSSITSSFPSSSSSSSSSNGTTSSFSSTPTVPLLKPNKPNQRPSPPPTTLPLLSKPTNNNGHSPPPLNNFYPTTTNNNALSSNNNHHHQDGLLPAPTTEPLLPSWKRSIPEPSSSFSQNSQSSQSSASSSYSSQGSQSSAPSASQKRQRSPNSIQNRREVVRKPTPAETYDTSEATLMGLKPEIGDKAQYDKYYEEYRGKYNKYKPLVEELNKNSQQVKVLGEQLRRQTEDAKKREAEIAIKKYYEKHYKFYQEKDVEYRKLHQELKAIKLRIQQFDDRQKSE